jgi:hypothetical protein
MTTIAELGSFLAGEKAAAAVRRRSWKPAACRRVWPRPVTATTETRR